MKNIHPSFLSGLLIILFVVSAGCSNIPPEDTAKELVPISSIGILPVQPARISILPSNSSTREQLEAGAEIVNSLLHDYFQDRANIDFISPAELQSLKSAQPTQPLYLAREAGQQLNYDAVLVTEVERYQTRTGSAYAVDSPASVALSFKLLAIARNQIIWSADFDQTQQALFDNILRSRSTGSGFRWLTAAELAKAGMKKKLDNCPYLKN
ncbi:MAG: hypothetical protein R3297_05295 [Desulfobulbales bacterium]|nr:hypothetical protein [Desulfobulbales bacterium]